ncbi:uncharacterized protein LOC113774401 [Coffea eugenioides]|uniref:uncharacterized protein LOC113750734 n=1 Tax=Coffea eugenioides TaxID=49369 RepID=UPI000F615347|nr:uncharacterized protein LOC113750734 [Coffea eugenioides]XP_027174307.1 uncharacterized protein LOC113773908 [Coffea eugenioides]XP_027174745.1 uncharacterized protein LOC113774401 [Coffea eugenioides]
MAGPGKRGQMLQRKAQGAQQPAIPNSVGSNQPRSASKSVSSEDAIYVTPTSSPREIASESRMIHHQTSESRASGENETNPVSDEQENAMLLSARRRGRTRNLSLSKKREANETLTIEIDDCIRRIVGKDSQYFITEGGCVVRKAARLNVPKWSHLNPGDREGIYSTVTDDFRFSEHITSKTAINRQLNTQYRNHRYRLHKYFQSFESRQEALRQVPEGVSEEDWKWLVSYFENDEFKKISERNKQNRAKNDCYTTVGTKSLARVVEEKKRKEDVELSEIDMFELSRKSKK